MSLNLSMKISEVGIALIKKAEGFSPRLYEDEGRPCIGYGCDLTDEEAKEYDGVAITADQGDKLLRAKLPAIEQVINDNVAVPLTQNAFDAICDFIYNEGAGHFTGSTLLRYLNAGDYTATGNEFLRWDYAGGHVNVGLYNRRVEEQRLFMTADESAT